MDIQLPKKKHLEPKCRLELVSSIVPFANAMTDVSDGLFPEIRNICENSRLGAEIYKHQIPIANTTFFAAKALKLDAYDFALYGGEDFELVYTVAPEKAKDLPGIEIGRNCKK